MFITPAVREYVTHDQVESLLYLHSHGVWDDMDPEDVAANEEAVSVGNRVVSIHFVRGEKVWVMTESDRSYTTLLFPHEY